MYASVSALPGAVVPVERRRAPRVEVLGQLHGAIVALRMTVVVREVGPGGFSIETPIPFPGQSRQQFRFSTGAGGPDVVLSGESVHCVRVTAPDAADAAPRFLTGFTFVCDDEASRRTAEALVHSLGG